MQHRKLDRSAAGAALGLLFFLAPAIASALEFRTPARRFGAAYSIKAEIVRDGVRYVIPVWIRPDQKESTLDPGQLRFAGWSFGDYRAEEVILAGHSLGKFSFRPARSDWVVKPEYPKNCCMGVIGRDLLSRFRVRFDPKPPSHIEWQDVPAAGAPVQTPTGFEEQLRPLFTTRTEIIEIGKSRYNMSSTSFTLDVSKRELSFERLRNGQARNTGAPPLFEYDFIGPVREVEVLSLGTAGKGAARTLGFHPGVRVRELDGVPVSGMTRADVDSYLRGRRGKTLEIGFFRKPGDEKKSKLLYDFEKSEFAPLGGDVPEKAGRTH